VTAVAAGREQRRLELENAGEALSVSRREVDELQRALSAQLAENADLVRLNADLKALLDDKQAKAAEWRTLLDVIAQSTQTLKGMT
jgi:hypothetical protein